MTMEEYEREIRRRVWRRRVRAATRALRGGRCEMMTWGEFVRGVVGAAAMAVGMVAMLAMLAMLAVLVALAPDELSGEGDWAIAEEARLSAAGTAE